MHRVYTASLLVNGLQLQQAFSTNELASLWLRMMTAQYYGQVDSPVITCTIYSDIFNAPMTCANTRRCKT